MNAKQRRTKMRRETRGFNDLQKQMWQGLKALTRERPPLGHKDNPLLVSYRMLPLFEKLGWVRLL